MLERRPDDAAQDVLRALLAWPVLGVSAGALAAGVAAGFGDPPRRLLVFGLGAGLGAGLVAGPAALLARRAGRAGPIVELALLVLLAPLACLGGEFALHLVGLGASDRATEALLDAHRRTPLALLDLDAALSVAFVCAGSVVGRGRGWGLAAQAALGAWVVLAGVALRLAAGRLDCVPFALVLAVEVALAALLPFAHALADRAVRRGRRRLAGGEGEGPGDVDSDARWSGRPRAALVVALVVALVAALGLGRARATGWEVRATVGLRLGADPSTLFRSTVQSWTQREQGPWLCALGWRQPAPDADGIRELLERAADGGDHGAMCWLTASLDTGPALRTEEARTPSSDELRWLRALVRSNELVGIRRLLLTAPPEGADAALACDALLDPAHVALRDPATLLLVWRRIPARRAQVEAILAAAPEEWGGTTQQVLDEARRQGVRPGRPLVRARVERFRPRAVPGKDARSYGSILSVLLDLDPALALPGDVAAIDPEPLATSWPDALLALDVGPLDPERSPLLAAAARGDHAAVWSGTTVADDRPLEATALRARAHVLLAGARRSEHAAGALRLAAAHLRDARAELDPPAGALDHLLVALHEALLDGYPGSATPHLVQLEVVEALDPEGRAQARLAALRPLVLDLFDPPGPGSLTARRVHLAGLLRAAAGDPRAGARTAALQRAAADRLEALR